MQVRVVHRGSDHGAVVVRSVRIGQRLADQASEAGGRRALGDHSLSGDLDTGVDLGGERSDGRFAEGIEGGEVLSGGTERDSRARGDLAVGDRVDADLDDQLRCRGDDLAPTGLRIAPTALHLAHATPCTRRTCTSVHFRSADAEYSPEMQTQIVRLSLFPSYSNVPMNRPMPAAAMLTTSIPIALTADARRSPCRHSTTVS